MSEPSNEVYAAALTVVGGALAAGIGLIRRRRLDSLKADRAAVDVELAEVAVKQAEADLAAFLTAQLSEAFRTIADMRKELDGVHVALRRCEEQHDATSKRLTETAAIAANAVLDTAKAAATVIAAAEKAKTDKEAV